METKKMKEKPTPRRCICGKEAAISVFRGKKMVSCPNPEGCLGNFKTGWRRSEIEAVVDWNNMIYSYDYAGRWHHASK